MTPIWKQVDLDFRIRISWFQPPKGGPSTKSEKVWMFDNEIDWVMRIRCASSYRLALWLAEGMRIWMTQYKAEHKQ